MTSYVRFCFFGLTIASILFLASTGQACIPVGGPKPPCSVYWQADAVFVGVVSDITKAQREPKEPLDKLLLRFSVDQPYRGVDSSNVEVAATTGTECDTKFQKGEKWLVYARRNPATERLEVWARTSLYSRANEDLSYIRSLSEGAHEASIIGGVFVYPYTPWQGIRIEIEGNGIKYKVISDRDGQFKVSGVEPGRYLIRGRFPARTGVTGDRAPSRIKENSRYTLVEYQEEIEAGRCGYLEFLVMKAERQSDQR